MTIEEKAKAYDEAVRVGSNILKSTTCEVALTLKQVIPALDKTESEDERIRKGLLSYIKGESNRLDTTKWIAYLEKLKEQKILMSDGEIEDRKRDIVAAIRKYYPAGYAEYLTSFLKGLSPEDNSDDEYGQKMLGIAYKLMYEYIPENLRTQEFWDALKFMREYTGRVAIIHSYEHPAEWSEEDEKILRFYEADYNNQIDDMSMKDVINMRLEFKNWLVNRLKSLRPRYNQNNNK